MIFFSFTWEVYDLKRDVIAIVMMNAFLLLVNAYETEAQNKHMSNDKLALSALSLRKTKSV